MSHLPVASRFETGASGDLVGSVATGSGDLDLDLWLKNPPSGSVDSSIVGHWDMFRTGNQRFSTSIVLLVYSS